MTIPVLAIGVTLTIAWRAHAQDALPGQLETLLSDLRVSIQQLEQSQGELAARLKQITGESNSEVPNLDGIHFFETNIRPVLLNKCVSCHGPDKQKAGLRLDSRDAAMRGSDHGPVIVAGDVEKSKLVLALRYIGDVQMPPNSALPPSEIAAFEEWIRMGAPWPADGAANNASQSAGIDYEKWRDYWAFKPITNTQPPAVENNTWSRTGADAFLLARMREAGIEPAPQADRRALIRRATFDLTGLPPAPEEVDAFLSDGSPDAFEKVVNRLLASPHYGERWGRHWLDVVRYTDSFDSRGSMATDPVEIWRYRDWVVNAFNADMPYDRFMMYQIAGDVIAPETPAHPADPSFNAEGIIATGMLAIGHWPQGDADKEKMVTDIVDDQVDVISRGFLAMTMSCARCHDHKFDPFSMRDYYAMAGIFFSSTILPGPGQKTEGSPILHIPLVPKSVVDAEEKRKARVAEVEGKIAEMLDQARVQWMRDNIGQADAYILAAGAYRKAKASGEAITLDTFAQSHHVSAEGLQRWINFLGLEEHTHMKTPIRDIAGIPGLNGLRGRNDTPSITVNTTNAEAKFATIAQPARSLSVHPSPAASVAAVWTNPAAELVSIEAEVIDSDAVCGDGVAWRVERWPLRGGSTVLLEGSLDNGGQSGAVSVPAVEMGAHDRVALVIEPKGGHACDTTTLRFIIHEIGGDRRTWNLTHDALAQFSSGTFENPAPDAFGNTHVWHFLDMTGSSAEIVELAQAEPLIAQWRDTYATDAIEESVRASAVAIRDAVAALATNDLTLPIDEKSAKGLAKILTKSGPLWLSSPPLPSEEVHQQITALRSEVEQLRAAAPAPFDTAVGIQEGGVPNTPHAGTHDVAIHIRGDYNRLGDVVPRGFPVVLAGNRQRPITDGSGRRELAKWLADPKNPLPARVMVNRIWQHHFGNGIVRTSGNFGIQGEKPSHPELLDYLATKFVESGWSIKAIHREIMLSSAYQQSAAATEVTLARDPDNRLFSRMNRRRLDAEEIRDAMLAVAGRLDTTPGGPASPDLLGPRRTIYYRTVRSDRASFNMLFDAADPTAITDKRIESTVAPQALFMLNHPFALQQADALYERIRTSTPDVDERIRHMYALLFAREPTAEEITLGQQMIAGGGVATGGDAEKRAWTQYAQVLFCSNEFMFVD